MKVLGDNMFGQWQDLNIIDWDYTIMFEEERPVIEQDNFKQWDCDSVYDVYLGRNKPKKQPILEVIK